VTFHQGPRVRSLSGALAALSVCTVLGACSTHRRDLESQAPPRGAPSQSEPDAARIAMTLLRNQAARSDLASSEAVAPLTEAACILFRKTGSARAYNLVELLASTLIASQVSRGGVSGFFGKSTHSLPSAAATAAAGLALAEAYAVTRQPTYREAVLAAAADITNPALGWISSASGVGVRLPHRTAGPNIALTANAAILLKRAAALGDAEAAVKSEAALRTIYSSQAAVGRWYADVGGHLPMSLDEWGATLFDLIADGSRESLGILGGGVSAIYANAFGAEGEILNNIQTAGKPRGVAIALRALAAYEVPSLADRVFANVGKLVRRDGTVSLASSDDAESQADFALAFAQRLSGHTQGE
jgi:hypothetical protein